MRSASQPRLCACLCAINISVGLLLVSIIELPLFGQSTGTPPAKVCIDRDSSFYTSAQQSFAAKEYRQSAVLFAEAERACPEETDSLLYEGKALVNVGDFVGADRALRVHLAKNPRSAEAFYLLGFVLQRENKPKESLEVFTRAAALQTPQANDLKIVGLDYVLLDDYRDAIHWLSRAVAIDPLNSEAWYYLGRAQMNQGHFVEAEQAFTRVLELSPRDVKAENNLGLVYEAQNRNADALKAYEMAVAWQSTSEHPSEQPMLNYGTLLISQNRPSEAIAVLEPAVRIAPSNAACHEQLARAYLQTGKIKDAVAEMSRAVQLEPGNSRFHYELGRIYRKDGMQEAAQQEFSRSAALYGTKSTPEDK